MTFTDTLMRALAVLGLVAVLLLGAWGIIQIALWIPTLFNHEPAPIVQQNAPATQQATQTQPEPTPAPAPARTPAKVVAKTARAALYGLPDLSVNIISNSRGTVQFRVQNIGTNIAPAGWSFTAALPNASVPYVEAGQKSLNPGDGVIYTLGYNANYGGYSYYNNYNYGYAGYYGHNYSTNCGYSLSYTYNGVYNYPTQGPYTCVMNQNNSVVTITVDPQNFVQEYNKNNNTVTVAAY